MSDYLVCRASDEPPNPPRLISFHDFCTFCGTRVWRAFSSPKDTEPICEACFRKEIDKGDPVLVKAQTPEQVADKESQARRLQN